MVENIKNSRDEFNPKKTLIKFFRGELSYWKKYGMSALDVGYIGKKL